MDIYIIRVHVCSWHYTCNYVGPGVYLGYPTREKYRCWVADLTQVELDAAERSSTGYVDLGKKLLQLLFSRELSEPDKYCCTKSEGKQLLDQLKLQGIRCKHYLSKCLMLVVCVITHTCARVCVCVCVRVCMFVGSCLPKFL